MVCNALELNLQAYVKIVGVNVSQDTHRLVTTATQEMLLSVTIVHTTSSALELNLLVCVIIVDANVSQDTY